MGNANTTNDDEVATQAEIQQAAAHQTINGAEGGHRPGTEIAPTWSNKYP